MQDLSGSAGQRPIRVLIVDDSATVRAVLRRTMSLDPRLSVVGEASDPFEAREAVKALAPDLLTLDIEMPRMNGLEFLDRLMRARPMPVVIVSSRAGTNSADAVRALSLGALDCVNVARVLVDEAARHRLTEILVAAGRARVGQRPGGAGPARAGGGAFRWNGAVVVIGSSTGGVDAIERVLAPFPANCPPTVIAQHMPAGFLESFARRLDGQVPARVSIARYGEALEQGRILIAGGGAHHTEIAGPAPCRTLLVPGTPDDLYIPSVDRLFHSAARTGAKVIGVVLTGMGRDGADGLLALRAAGARTLAQSAETCVIDGMPGAARKAGAVEDSVALDRMGAAILRHAARGRADAA